MNKMSKYYFDKKILKNHIVLISLFSILGLIIRLHYLPFDVPITLDGEGYFWYAYDMKILGEFPDSHKFPNNLWPSILSIFFNFTNSENFLDYMNMQRVISSIISSLTIFPVYFLAKKFLNHKYSLFASILFLFEPRLIINSTLGITESLYLFLIILSISMILSNNKKMVYTSFATGALASLTRYEGLLILIPLTIIFILKYKKESKIILKYLIVFTIFIIVLFPMISIRVENTGRDGLTSHLIIGPRNVNEVIINEYDSNILNSIYETLKQFLMFIFWISFPIFFIFLPLGILNYLKDFKREKKFLLLFCFVLIIPSLYAFLRNFDDTRYLFSIFPLFAIISGYSFEKIETRFKKKLLISLLFIIFISSIMFLEVYSEDAHSQIEHFIIAKKITELTNISNEFYPESKYISSAYINKNFPIQKLELQEKHIFLPLQNEATVIDYIKNNQMNGLKFIIVDENSNKRSENEKIFYLVYENENQFPFLKKVFDSKDIGLEFHVKIFEILYEKIN